jgi:hypothetical protein
MATRGRELILERPGAVEKEPPLPAEPKETREEPIVLKSDPRFTSKAQWLQINGRQTLCMGHDAAVEFMAQNRGKLPEKSRRVYTERGWIYALMHEPARVG